jgi:hypothetical protein
MEFHAWTAWTLTFPRRINRDSLVPANSKQGLAGNFVFFVRSLQLKGIKPNTTAPTLADVHDKAPDLYLGEIIEASWTFHI